MPLALLAATSMFAAVCMRVGRHCFFNKGSEQGPRILLAQRGDKGRPLDEAKAHNRVG